MSSVESLDNCKSNADSLAATLNTLLEPSPTLLTAVVRLSNTGSLEQCRSYTNLIDIVFDVIGGMDSDKQAEFIAGHPRIGEAKNLSNLSAKEQAAKAAPPEVLERLAWLNDAYEERFPKLRYITFVNGRSRQQIADELEVKLADIPRPIEAYSTEWRTELARALDDVKLIAKSRLRTLGIE